jgi:hypothetical protein
MWNRIRWLAILFLVLSPVTNAHVGSPDVFYEGMAGPYRLLVTVRTPPMVPGIAQIEVNAIDGEVKRITIVALRVVGEGASNAPPPDVMSRSEANPRHFTGPLWLMASGSWQVRMEVFGDRGSAEMAVPIAAAARRSLRMQRALGAILLALMGLLVCALISIVGAATGESQLSPGDVVGPQQRRFARVSMAATAVVLAGILLLGNKWWDAAAAERRDLMIYKPPPMQAALTNQNTLALKLGFSAWHDRRKTTMLMDKIIPDHGHLLHAFLLRVPELDRFYHLHPERTGDNVFSERVPAMVAGEYQIFADIVRESGFADTMSARITSQDLLGEVSNPDDAVAVAVPLSQGKPNLVATLPDGGRVQWDTEGHAMRAGTTLLLCFRVLGPDGNAARELQPYMGMAGHLVVVKHDLSVFAHLHPAGSVPMAAVMLLNANPGAYGGMTGMTHGRATGSPADIAFPYGFPQAGEYRLFLQFKLSKKIQTAVFDANIGD